MQVQGSPPPMGDKDVHIGAVGECVDIGTLMVVPWASRRGSQGVGKDETWLTPCGALVHRERHPDLAAVGLLEVAARMAVVVKGHKCLAVGVLKQHRWRVRMNQHGRFWLGPGAPIVVGAGFPEVSFARANKDHDFLTA